MITRIELEMAISLNLYNTALPSASECHPIINEISSLRFTTSAAAQYFELALNDACNSKSNVMLNEYGLLVLNTNSRRVKKPDHFNTITFVDFGNHKWPREDGELAKYFVIGSSAVETTSIDWNFYSTADKHAQCSRFVNWPQCLVRLIDPHQASKIDTFFTSLSTPQRNTEMPQTVFALVHLPNANDANLFKTYFSLLKTTDGRNVVYRRNHLDVSSDQQRWLSTGLKHIGALSPTSDHTKMLPMDRLIPIFGCPTTIVLHHLLPDAINDIISVSLCGCRWALTTKERNDLIPMKPKVIPSIVLLRKNRLSLHNNNTCHNFRAM
ncbi:unnamed protein product [Heligmosomoides polygyrus]|uniref:Uncharacterized protein n=1 Tax=Heligmosomoides polygyrus TaxID=6339 RepID=A0A183GQ96_HELPZ|nr:unnamed protein product [Heligmosomoides polygyrus]